MNKIFLLTIIAFISASSYLFSAETAEIEKLKITILPITNSSGQKEINKAAEKVKSVSMQTLLLLEKYIVIDEKNALTAEDFKNYCTENESDFILFGNISKQEKNIIVNISVYSMETDSVIINSKETAVSPVNFRNAIKKASSSALSSLSDTKVEFTSLAFTNMTDETGKYSVYIDDILFGENIDYLELLLSGTRNIKIIQKRIYGNYKAAEINALLIPGDRVSIEFKIPPLLEKEEKYVERYSKTIKTHLDDKYYSQKVASSFDKIFMLLENPDFSKTAVNKKSEISSLYTKWLLNMKQWDTSKGFTAADKPFSLGFKTMFLISTFDISDWDMGGTDPDGISASSMAYSISGSADIFKFMGLQTEINVCNQKTKTSYPTGYPPANYSEIETSTWFVEAPAIIYLRAPENLIKLYGGVSYKYRLTPLRTEGTVMGTGETKSDKYDDELLRIHLPAWLAGFAIEIPYKSNVFSLDFRYNRDFKSWFDKNTPEEDYIANYIACSLGYTAKY